MNTLFHEYTVPCYTVHEVLQVDYILTALKHSFPIKFTIRLDFSIEITCVKHSEKIA